MKDTLPGKWENTESSLSRAAWAHVPDVTWSRSLILAPSGMCDLNKGRQSLAKRQISYPLLIPCHNMSHFPRSCQVTHWSLPLSQDFLFPLCPHSSDALQLCFMRESSMICCKSATPTNSYFVHQPWRSTLRFTFLHMVWLQSKVPEEQTPCSGSEWWRKVKHWGITPPFPQHPLCASGRLEFQIFPSIRNQWIPAFDLVLISHFFIREVKKRKQTKNPSKSNAQEKRGLFTSITAKGLQDISSQTRMVLWASGCPHDYHLNDI